MSFPYKHTHTNRNPRRKLYIEKNAQQRDMNGENCQKNSRIVLIHNATFNYIEIYVFVYIIKEKY